MIDLHIHSTHSDGNHSVKAILKELEGKNILLASITDHDTIKGYREELVHIKESKVSLVTGVEIKTIISDSPAEILCYGVDIAKFNSQNIIKPQEETQTKILKELCYKFKIKEDLELDVFAHRTVYNHLKASNKLIKIVGKDLSSREFYRYCNSEEMYRVDEKDYYPSIKHLQEITREIGQKTILAHPMSYKNAKHIMEESLKYVDGIEILHPSTPSNHVQSLLEYCNRKSMLISGGSDMHENISDLGKFPGVLDNNLYHINLIEEWVGNCL